MSFKTTQLENIKFPRFREQQKSKYIRNLKQKQQLSGSLHSHRWCFLSPGLDDFRDHYPTVHKVPFTQCKCALSPVVFGMLNHACSVKLQQKKLSKNQMCYSKQNFQSHTQREFIDAIEHKLKQHPMALYPHLESGMTPEVLSVLDPDMCMKEELSITKKTEKHLEERRAKCEISTQEIIKQSTAIKPPKDKSKDTRARNPYKWQELKERDKENQMEYAKQSQEDKQMFVKFFCEWIASLGGETSDLRESTILDLFRSDYEKKTTLTLPISKRDTNQPPGKCHSSVKEHLKDYCVELTEAFKPKILKAAYDSPKALADVKRDLNFDASKQDKELKQVHGIHAFREFIVNKGVRMPRVLSENIKFTPYPS
ncbi:putative protein FAM47C isoform X2 [Danio aesculapii]|uniref:putative protein FAM47C isoform X2 n=1 Tax=Danio aesculapii TaxID=1142201 RepID=UPI0024BF996D|nr:putative protein FAM47C isoform X2 [Danio aesculapii]